MTRNTWSARLCHGPLSFPKNVSAVLGMRGILCAASAGGGKGLSARLPLTLPPEPLGAVGEFRTSVTLVRNHALHTTFQRAVRHDSCSGRGSPTNAMRILSTEGLAPHRPPMWGLFLSVSPLRHKAKRLARGYIAAHNVAARVDPERAGGCRSGEVDGDVVSVHGQDKTVEPGRIMLHAGDLARGIHVPRGREIAARDDE